MARKSGPPKEPKAQWLDGPRPATTGWREGTLTRANELEAQYSLVPSKDQTEEPNAFAIALCEHLKAARQAAMPSWKRIIWIFRHGSLIERASTNLDAAEANLLRIARHDYVLGQLPSLLAKVQRHLAQTDPRRQEFERIAQRFDMKDPDHPLALATQQELLKKAVEEERGKIVAIARAASSAALREQVRIRSFRNVIVVTTLAMTLLMVGVALIGFLNHRLIPICFTQENAAETVVCPIRSSDESTEDVASSYDLFVVEFVGLSAAAIASATAIQGIRGSSERYGLPVAMAVLKLPTGALTAFLGLLLMRGEFVPGLTALDTPAQILAWAVVFGYAQQVFTRLVDRQGQVVLDSVRDVDKAAVTAPR